MKVILTGMTGTLAPYVNDALKKKGYEVIAWNRSDVSTENQEEINQFIQKTQPDYFFHLATGPEAWIQKIINALKPYSIPFLFTSTESVYDESQKGPFTTKTEPGSMSDYGKYKRSCENTINENYADNAYIVRIGWQIGLEPVKNNMLKYLVNNSPIYASDQWIPSTSFMPDTANALIKIIESFQPGLYHVDGNEENWNFYQIVVSLKEVFSLPITIYKDSSFTRNNRLINDPILIQSIQETIRQLMKQKNQG